MDIDQEIVRSLASLRPQIDTVGWGQVARQRVQAMARSGDMAILTMIIDHAIGQYSGTALTAPERRDVDLALGGILALRGIWNDLRNLGLDPDETAPVETTERNEFAIMPELEEDLTRTY
jgi:hypothetical protein